MMKRYLWGFIGLVYVSVCVAERADASYAVSLDSRGLPVFRNVEASYYTAATNQYPGMPNPNNHTSTGLPYKENKYTAATSFVALYDLNYPYRLAYYDVLRVTAPNGRSIIVVITDVGTLNLKTNRLLDLSPAAFQALGYNLSAGVIPNLTVTVVQRFLRPPEKNNKFPGLAQGQNPIKLGEEIVARYGNGDNNNIARLFTEPFQAVRQNLEDQRAKSEIKVWQLSLENRKKHIQYSTQGFQSLNNTMNDKKALLLANLQQLRNKIDLTYQISLQQYQALNQAAQNTNQQLKVSQENLPQNHGKIPAIMSHTW